MSDVGTDGGEGIDWLLTVALPIGTYIAGWLTRTFIPTKKERQDQAHRIYQNGEKHRRQKDERLAEFSRVLKAYIEDERPESIDTFYEISTKGDLYFAELTAIADAIREGQISTAARDDTFVPAINEALRKSVPKFYEALSKIADRLDTEYTGSFRRQNYKSMFEVAIKYGDMTEAEAERLTS